MSPAERFDLAIVLACLVLVCVVFAKMLAAVVP